VRHERSNIPNEWTVSVRKKLPRGLKSDSVTRVQRSCGLVTGSKQTALLAFGFQGHNHPPEAEARWGRECLGFEEFATNNP